MKIKRFIKGLQFKFNRNLYDNLDYKQTDNQDLEKDHCYRELLEKIDELETKLENNSFQVEKIKSIFLKNIYHEIRTPLNAIVGFTNLLEMGNDEEKEQREYRNQIAISSREFLKIMDNIIEASLIEAGMIKLSEDQCNLNALLSEIYAYFKIQRHIQEKGNVAFLLNIPKNNACDVICDKHRINQILTNLLSNAFKFTEKGIVEIGYKIVNKEKIHFFVKDSGIGGLDDVDTDIFRSFVKLDNSANSKKGLGLGLSISKYLIEMMGGEIWYEPNKTAGTTFNITIPYRPVAVNDSADVNKLKKKQYIQSPSLTSLKSKSLPVA